MCLRLCNSNSTFPLNHTNTLLHSNLRSMLRNSLLNITQKLHHHHSLVLLSHPLSLVHNLPLLHNMELLLSMELLLHTLLHQLLDHNMYLHNQFELKSKLQLGVLKILSMEL